MRPVLLPLRKLADDIALREGRLTLAEMEHDCELHMIK
jgi:hypothetical protein